MIFGLILGAIVVIVIFAAWYVGLTALFVSKVRLLLLRWRKVRTIETIRSEGRATRERITAADRHRTRSSLEVWINQPRRRLTTRRRATIIIACSAALAIAVSPFLWRSISTSHQTVSRQSLLDAVIGHIKRGECTNFTNNFQTDALPRHPRIVRCEKYYATFKVAWRGHPRDQDRSCPQKFSTLSWWTAGNGVTVCMDRVYRRGQCMQGRRRSSHSFEWFDEAVVPCTTSPTRHYSIIVEIARVYSRNHDYCNGHSSAETDVDNAPRLTLCIVRHSEYGQ
jgi:hypothetical protein